MKREHLSGIEHCRKVSRAFGIKCRSQSPSLPVGSAMLAKLCYARAFELPLDHLLNAFDSAVRAGCDDAALLRIVDRYKVSRLSQVSGSMIHTLAAELRVLEAECQAR